MYRQQTWRLETRLWSFTLVKVWGLPQEFGTIIYSGGGAAVSDLGLVSFIALFDITRNSHNCVLVFWVFSKVNIAEISGLTFKPGDGERGRI